jgi:glycerol-3-phosphate dehydrogenase
MLFFVVPHQFLSKILSQLKELGGVNTHYWYSQNSDMSLLHLSIVVDSSAVGISLIKGVKFVDEMNCGEVPLQLLSANIQSQLNLSSVAVLMGANVAADVAQDKVISEFIK